MSSTMLDFLVGLSVIFAVLMTIMITIAMEHVKSIKVLQLLGVGFFLSVISVMVSFLMYLGVL